MLHGVATSGKALQHATCLQLEDQLERGARVLEQRAQVGDPRARGHAVQVARAAAARGSVATRCAAAWRSMLQHNVLRCNVLYVLYVLHRRVAPWGKVPHHIARRSSKMSVSESWNRIEMMYGKGPLFTPA